MKNKLEAIEWLIEQSYAYAMDDWNTDKLKSIRIVLKESQTMFSDDDLLGIYLCGSSLSKDWRKVLADHKEMINKTNTNNI